MNTSGQFEVCQCGNDVIQVVLGGSGGLSKWVNKGDKSGYYVGYWLRYLKSPPDPPSRNSSTMWGASIGLYKADTRS